MTTYIVQVTEKDRPYFDKGRSYSADVEFVLTHQRRQTRGTRYTLHFADADSVDRETTGAPLAQGAYAFFSPQATVIHSGPYVEGPPVLTMTEGDRLILTTGDFMAGILAVIEVGPDRSRALNDPSAVIVQCEPATQDHSAWVAEKNAVPIDPKYLSESYLSG